jgi:hypothetical protein
MNWMRALLGLTTFSVIACTGMGCSSTKDDDDSSDDALTDTTPGQWVVDMKKVAQPTDRGGYGRSSQLFFGLGPSEYLCQQGEAADSCSKKPPVWDQTFHFGPQVGEDGSITFRKPFANDKVNAVIKTADGKLMGPKGKGLNIIPLLKNTDPTKQTHLRKWLKNGDVLTFFHPEQNSMRNMMDRRASHVAFHYDYKSPLTGKEYVHHVDNPNNYGPRYNYPPSRNMPFHVFRYQPKDMDAKKAAAYALAARSWAFMDDDLSPFADFFDLQLQTQRDMKTKFVDRLLAGNEIAEVYCSGLAYTNLNLGTNYPLKPGMITRDYRRNETGEVFRAADCANPSSENCVLSPAKYGDVDSASLEGRNKFVFPSYTTSDLANAWLDNTYGELPLEKRAEIAGMPQTQAQIGQGLYNVQWSDADGKPTGNGDANVPTSVVAPENLKAWGDSYAATLAVGKAMKAGNAADAAKATQQYIDSHQLKTKDGQLVGMADLIAKHNASQPADADPEKWVAIDAQKMTPQQILRALEIAHVENRYVPPRIWMDTADDRQYLPSGFDPRTDSNAEIVYVGTVISCELLSAADGSAADACADSGGGMDEFSEGGADTSTYPHYAVVNSGERTHRRFDSSTGPAQIGKGSRVTVRATTFDMTGVRFLLHTPDLYAEGYNDYVNTLFANIPADALPADARQRGLAGMNVRDYDTACTAMNAVAASQHARGACSPKRAIVMDVAKSEEVARQDARAKTSGPIPDAVYTFDLTKICRIGSGDKMTCPVVTQKPDGSGWDFDHVQDAEVSRSTAGLIAATMVDVGGDAQAQAPTSDPNNPNAARDDRAYGLCTRCGSGGGHFNQWTITIRNDR